jgi:hypothetical protein
VEKDPSNAVWVRISVLTTHFSNFALEWNHCPVRSLGNNALVLSIEPVAEGKSLPNIGKVNSNNNSLDLAAGVLKYGA